MDDATYVRRRRWSAQEKCAVVGESVTSGNVIATAKRHGIQAQQIYRWRERLEARPACGAFLAVRGRFGSRAVQSGTAVGIAAG
ncbi:transposase [Methylobacterium sp. HMF5984]|uniref:transposase n=1 Tax=Methylobacterium sp. HMF5984 TaxID=3367370 RepID=UPI003854610F